MKPNEAKREVQAFLDRHGLKYSKLTARNISFQDLAQSYLFVTVHGWEPNSKATDLRKLSTKFCVDFSS